jgi:hypothetical protein
LIGLIVVLLGLRLEAEEAQPDSASTPAKAPAKGQPANDAAEPAHKFIRVVRDDAKRPLSMQTAVVSFIGAHGTRPGVMVDLIGAVHVGDKGYYAELDKLFESYDVLLYELVAPEGTKIPKGGRKGSSGHPIGALQNGMKSMLELEHQLDCVDYTKPNFVHADMSPEEFSKTMENRGESFTQMFLRMLGQGMAQQAMNEKNGVAENSEMAMLFALFSPDRARQLKIAMAEQFENVEGQMAIFDGPDGSTIITERNRKALEVLARELKAGKKKIGIFYGAGHLADMEKRLEADFDLQRDHEKWITAWQLEKAKGKTKQEKPAKAQAE